MKKTIILVLLFSFLITGCSEAQSVSTDSNSIRIQSDAIQSSLADSASESNSIVESRSTEHTDVKNDPYELENAIINEPESLGMIDDSEHFKSIEDMTNSVWAQYFSEKTNLSKDKLIPKHSDEIKEEGCVTHLYFWELGYLYKDKKYSIQVGVRKFDNIDELYKEYFEKDNGFMLKSDKTIKEGNFIIDEFNGYANGYMIFMLSSDGLECQIFTNDKSVTIDEMKAFASSLDF